jgi:hypothetical protein
MSRKPKLSRTEKDRRKQARERQEQAALVQDTINCFGCSVETADDMAHQCESRLADIDVDLTFADLAHHVWAGRPGHGVLLDPLLAELVAEQERHAAAMAALALRFRAVAESAQHQHLDDDAIDPDYVRTMLFTPPEDRRPRALTPRLPPTPANSDTPSDPA